MSRSMSRSRTEVGSVVGGPCIVRPRSPSIARSASTVRSGSTARSLSWRSRLCCARTPFISASARLRSSSWRALSVAACRSASASCWRLRARCSVTWSPPDRACRTIWVRWPCSSPMMFSSSLIADLLCGLGPRRRGGPASGGDEDGGFWAQFPVVGNRGHKERLGVRTVFAVAVAEGSVARTAQDRQLTVPVARPPPALPGPAFHPAELPCFPQRLQALDGLRVVPPLRAPLECPLDVPFQVRGQPLRYPGHDIGIDRRLVLFPREHSGARCLPAGLGNGDCLLVLADCHAASPSSGCGCSGWGCSSRAAAAVEIRTALAWWPSKTLSVRISTGSAPDAMGRARPRGRAARVATSKIGSRRVAYDRLYPWRPPL